LKILYDLIASQPEKTSKFHGGSEYCKTVFKSLISEGKDNQIEVVIDPSRDIDSKIIEICSDNKIKINRSSNIDELGKLINNNDYNIFYSALPYQYNRLRIKPNVRFIYTIHGLRSIEMIGDKYESKFEGKKLKYFTKKIINTLFPSVVINRKKKDFKELLKVTNNRTILVASYHTKYSILNFFPEIQENEIEVLYSPQKVIDDINFDKEDNILKKYNVHKKKYILLVSGDRWLKNNYRAIMALDILFSANRKLLDEIKVIVLGVDKKEVYLNNIKNKNRFIIQGYKDIDELEILYKNAHLFLYPTLNEGFGYPPLEAIKYSTYVAVSAISSTTEVCGDAVLYFNPYDTNEIGNRVLESFDNEFMEPKKELMKKQYKYISNKQSESLDKIIKLILN
jgi:Glycosyltransferase